MSDQPLPLKKVVKKGFIGKVKDVVIHKKPLTLRQEAVVAQVGKGLKNKGEILKNAGYSDSVSKKPSKVFDSPAVKQEMDTILSRLEAERDEVLERMKITRKKAGYAVLSMTLGTLNRDIELLSGRPTDRRQYELPEDEKEQLRKLLNKNKIK